MKTLLYLKYKIEIVVIKLQIRWINFRIWWCNFKWSIRYHYYISRFVKLYREMYYS